MRRLPAETFSMIDLHIHTTASSDGAHSPAEVFEMSRSLGLKAVAFADHNSIGSVAKGMELARLQRISFISGIEINTLHHDHDLHLLAYGFDPTKGEFAAWLDGIGKSKWDQARGRTEKLKKLGLALEWEELITHSGGLAPSGMNFIQVMLSRPENDGNPLLDPYRPGGSRADSPYLNFYLDYLRGGKPAFVPQEGVSTTEVIGRIISLGAVPVLAHPSDTPDDYIPDLLKAGLRGLEVYSSYHDKKLTSKWHAVAKSNNMLITAGSDFHGLRVKPDVRLADISGNSRELFDRLVESIPQKGGVIL